MHLKVKSNREIKRKCKNFVFQNVLIKLKLFSLYVCSRMYLNMYLYCRYTSFIWLWPECLFVVVRVCIIFSQCIYIYEYAYIPVRNAIQSIIHAGFMYASRNSLEGAWCWFQVHWCGRLHMTGQWGNMYCATGLGNVGTFGSRSDGHNSWRHYWAGDDLYRWWCGYNGGHSRSVNGHWAGWGQDESINGAHQWNDWAVSEAKSQSEQDYGNGEL